MGARRCVKLEIGCSLWGWCHWESLQLVAGTAFWTLQRFLLDLPQYHAQRRTTSCYRPKVNVACGRILCTINCQLHTAAMDGDGGGSGALVSTPKYSARASLM